MLQFWECVEIGIITILIDMYAMYDNTTIITGGGSIPIFMDADIKPITVITLYSKIQTLKKTRYQHSQVSAIDVHPKELY